MGRPTTGAEVSSRDLRLVGSIPLGGSPSSGPRFSHANKPTPWVVRPVLRPVQQGQAGPVGVRRPQQRRLPAQVRLDQHRPTPDRRQARRHPTTPPSPTTGPRRRRKAPLPIDKTSRRLIKAQDGRCPICQDALVPDDDRPQTPREWETWLATTRKTITKIIMPGGRHAGRA